MQVIGNLELLKKEIEDSFSRKLERFKKESTQNFEDEQKEIQEKHQVMLKKAKDDLKANQQKVFSTTLAEEKLKAKKEFEYTREGLINKVFQEAEAKSREFLMGKEYLDLVQIFIKDKKKLQVAGSSEEYKKYFPDIKTTLKIEGIVVKQGQKIFDFTYKTFIETKKSDLRHRLSEILFENVG